MAVIRKRRKNMLLYKSDVSDHKIGMDVTTHVYFDDRCTGVSSECEYCDTKKGVNRANAHSKQKGLSSHLTWL